MRARALAGFLAAAFLACGSPPRPTIAADSGSAAVQPLPDTTAPAAAAAAPVSPCDSAGNVYTSWNLPRWAQQALADTAFTGRFELFTRLNPYFLTGYFDGDSLADVAVQIQERGGGRRGVAMLHRGSGRPVILGAGTPVGNGGDDWSWLWVWRVEEPEGHDEPARRGRQLLLVEKPESASGYLWWDGSGYRWTQGAD